MLRQFKQFGRFGLAMAIFFIPMLTLENTNGNEQTKGINGVNSSSNSSISSQVKQNNDTDKNILKYNERMGDIIRDTIRLGYL